MSGTFFLLLTGVPSLLAVVVALRAWLASRGGRAWCVAILAALAGSWCSYHLLGAAQDWRLAAALAAYSPEGPLPEARLLAAVRTRIEARPENVHYLGLLARAAMEGDSWGEAAYWQKRMVDLAPDNADLLASYALALTLSRGGGIDAQVRQLLARSLALDPAQSLALSLRGQAAFLEDDLEAALEYWRRALEGLPGDSQEAEDLRAMIGILEQKMRP